MVDTPKKPLSQKDQNNLINRIDELETLLARKKTGQRKTLKTEETGQTKVPESPQLSVGTDGIPVLVEAVKEDDLLTDKDNQIINDIIDKIDQEITKDLDDLILMLKDSLIDKIKTQLLKELKINKDSK